MQSFSTASLASETIYLARSPSGRPFYTNDPAPGAQRLMQVRRTASPQPPAVFELSAVADQTLLAHMALGGAPRGPTAHIDAATQSLIQQAAARHRIDVHLLMSLIRQESGFNPDAVSHAGARGLMQLMPGTAKRYGVSHIHDPGQNIAGGSAYLRDLLDMFGSVDLALAAYNAGEGAVLRYGRRIPPYPETQHYVRAVLADYQRRRAGL